MEKKNTLLLTVIAVATLLVAVVGATFAYFGSFTNTVTNNTQVSAQTEKGKASSFTSMPGMVFLDVKAANMTRGADDDKTKSLAATSTGKDELNPEVTVVLDSAATDTFTICSFDLLYTDSSAEKYAKTAGITGIDDGMEFTYTLATPTSTLTKSTTAPAEATPAGSIKATSVVTTETDYSTLASANKLKVAEGLQISAKGGVNTMKIGVTLKFYNFPGVSQDAVSGKVYGGAFSVSEPVCTTSTTDTLA